MNRAIIMLLMLPLVTACGIKRPLIRPADVPAYEQKRAERMRKFEAPPATEQPNSSTPVMTGTTPLPSVPF